MPRVVGTAGNHSFEVWYGKQFSTKDLKAAKAKVKGLMVEAARAGFVPGTILHYPNDRKNCQPEELPFNN